MELDITQFYGQFNPANFSASAAELGQNAGQITWDNSMYRASVWMGMQMPLLGTEGARDAFRRFVRSSGGWSEEEIAAWSDQELEALCLQWISGDIRESCLDDNPDDWEGYRLQSAEGQVAGRLWRTDDGRIFWDCE